MIVFVVYGISDCPSCLRACADLMEAEHEYVFVEADFSPSYRRHLRDELKWPTFPIVVRKTATEDLVIGGYTQLQDFLRIP